MKVYKKFTSRHAVVALLLATGITLAEQSNAQLNPMGSMYFQNQYQANPAMAGAEKGLRLNAGYRQQWTSMPGAPTTQLLTGDYGFMNKVGLGLSIYNDKAGLLQRTHVAGTYAYHLPVSAEEKLSFGLSLGVMNQHIDNGDVRGDLGDVHISQFNDQQMFVDLDFGVAYSGKRITAQAAVPGMRSALKKEDDVYPADQSIFFTSVSYKMSFPQAMHGITLEPKVVFRGVRGFDNILDIGANMTFANDALSLMGMYHSSRSATYGVGVNYQNLSVLGMYTTQTYAMNGYANGNVALGLRFKLPANNTKVEM